MSQEHHVYHLSKFRVEFLFRELEAKDHMAIANFVKRLPEDDLVTRFHMNNKSRDIGKHAQDILLESLGDSHHAQAALHHGEIRGIADYIAEEDSPFVDYGIIVDPRSKCRGIGLALTAEAILAIEAMGHEGLSIHLEYRNQRARTFFLRILPEFYALDTTTVSPMKDGYGQYRLGFTEQTGDLALRVHKSYPLPVRLEE